MSSILWLSLVMFISPYSNLASCVLVLVLQGKDLLNELLLPLQGLLSRLLELLHVLTHSLELILDALQVLLSKLSPLKASLQLRLLDSELPAQLIKLLLVINGHLDGALRF